MCVRPTRDNHEVPFMKISIGVALSVAFIAWPLLGGEPFVPPTTATPSIAIVRKVDRKKGEVNFAVMSLSLQPQKHEDKKKPPPPPVARRELQEFTTGLTGFKFVTVGGKELTEKEGWDRLKIGNAVILTSDPKGVDPIFLTVLSKDAVMLIPDTAE